MLAGPVVSAKYSTKSDRMFADSSATGWRIQNSKNCVVQVSAIDSCIREPNGRGKCAKVR